MSEFDPVNNPRHYTEGRQYEPRRVAEDWGLVEDAYLFTAFKYIARAGRKPVDGSMLKGKIQDIEKAREYLGYRLELLHEQMLAEQEAKSHIASVWGGTVLCEPPAPVPVPNNDTAVIVDTNGIVELNPPLDAPDIFTTETRLRDIA